jgi:pyridoxamine 5'-phosphate oxidase
VSGAPLRRADLDQDPLRQFASWYSQASDVVPAPEAVVLATATATGAPAARMVLMKGFDQRGFVFYTNYFSRKGQEIAQNPRAAMLFHWQPLGRQLRIEGTVHRIDAAESDAYFATRPPGSRLSAAASPQSRPVESRAVLEDARCAAPRNGAACASSPPHTSSGSTATTASTTASGTAGRARCGWWSGSGRRGGF